jgi:hypothetical protein
MATSNTQLLGYLEAKLEALHADILEVQKEVGTLKADLIRRKSIANIAYTLAGVVTTAAVAWFTKHF